MDKDSLEKIFVELDVGGDGHISKSELEKLCDYFGMEDLSNAVRIPSNKHSSYLL